MKIGLMVFTANTRGDNQKPPYASIRAVARQAEADGFDSIWLADSGNLGVVRFENHVAWIESSRARRHLRSSRA